MQIENDKFTTPVKRKAQNNDDFLSLTEKCHIYLESKEGKSISHISTETKRSYKTIHRLITKALKFDTLENLDGNKGRYRKGSTVLTQRHTKMIDKCLTEENFHDSKAIWRYLISHVNLKRVSYTTVRNYVNTKGSWVVPRLVTEISLKNLIHRRDYCIAERTSIDDKDILFTDESSFQLNRNKIKIFKLNDEKVPTTKKLSRQTVMIWAGISKFGKTSVYFVENTINNEVYKDLLQQARKEILDIFGGEWYFLHDNAPSHKHENPLNYIRRWLTPRIIGHPAQSPDLNPIELVWARLKSLVEAKFPTNKDELKRAIVECWEAIDLDFIRRCIEGLPNRMEQAIEDAEEKILVALDIEDEKDQESNENEYDE
jgi:transposase